MNPQNERKFDGFWKKTEVICEYEQILYTFGDMNLPYIFVAEHDKFKDRTIVVRGKVYIRKPEIIVPGRGGVPEFKSGFENAESLPEEAVFMLRSMGLPFSEVNHEVISTKQLEYGSLAETIDRFEQQLKDADDCETGLIKGVAGGMEVSLIRYCLGLMIKSAKDNAIEFFEHLRRQRGEPIRFDEKVTDEDLRRLFG